MAQKRDDGSDRGYHQPKGWTALRVSSSGTTATECPLDGPDAGVTPDASTPPDGGAATDGGPRAGDGDGGCGCTVPGTTTPSGLAWLAVAAAVAFRTRRRRPHR